MKSLFLLSLRSLKKNSVRTFITSIGIVLSVILLATIIILFYSYKGSMIATTIQHKGDWHICIQNDADSSKYKSIEDKIDSFTKLENLGYSAILNAKNSQKPYLHIMAIDTNYPEMMPIEIIKGKFPTKNTEVIVSSDYAELYEVEIGSALNLSIGNRMSEYGIRWQNASYLGEENEYITNEFDAHYYVVGICYTPSYIEYSFSPGYSILTHNNIDEYDRAYVKLNNPRDALILVDETSNDIIPNKDLLDVLIIQAGESVGNAIRAIALFLIIIVLIVSFVLIVNSYMITLNERSKEYALLTSIGTTNKQLLLLTLFENLILGLLLVPLSILISIGLMHFSFKSIVSFVNFISYTNIVFQLQVSMEALLIIASLSLFTIIFSSITPFMLNMRKNIISGVRQNDIIKLKYRNTQKSRKTFTLWEVDYIYKNFKRYKNKYKFTIISILISIVLFTSINIVITTAKTQMQEDMDIAYDISCNSSNYTSKYVLENIYEPISKMEGIEEGWWEIQDRLGTYFLLDSTIINNQLSYYVEQQDIDSFPINYVIVNDKIYNKLLVYMGQESFNAENLNENDVPAIANITDYSSNNYNRTSLFNKNQVNIDVNSESLLANTIVDNMALHIIDTTRSNFPKELTNHLDFEGIIVFFPLTKSNLYINEVPNYMQLFFKCENHRYSYAKMLDFQKTNELNIYITNHSLSYDRELNTVSIINLFTDIMMIIIVIISVTNILNTVFSSIVMRRKEFALLTSIGMLKKSLIKILLLENLLILACTLFISILITLFLSVIFKFVLGSAAIIYPVKKY